ncbi:IS3 family transposase [Oscillibacter valericigenes]|uniref:IS3 family transposase n=1 Tax=Oscillibacter valericigenes TaxID=351091 RepID=UPI00195E5B8F|nr:IS3 family transposase [Oscillibacter valericigenes]MBM6910451.1 transposase [Oscillibacter valericigenes]
MNSAGERFAAIQEALADRKNIFWVRSERARETREQKSQADFGRILETHQFRGYAKGTRGIHMRLLHMGVRMNVKKIRRLMRKYRLACPIWKPNPYRRLQRSIRYPFGWEVLLSVHNPERLHETGLTLCHE